MFEQLPSSPPPQKVEDIFSEVESAVPKSSNNQLVNSLTPSAAEDAKQGIKYGLTGKLGFKIALGLFSVLVLGGGFWLLYNKGLINMKNNDKVINSNTVNKPDDLPNPTPTNQNNNNNNNNNQQNLVEVDSDNDGLSDSEEQTLGTNSLQTDSDADGLFDREEVKIYKTNPLVADTDGDNYIDGTEVKNGYDPNGPGKLLQLPINNQ